MEMTVNNYTEEYRKLAKKYGLYPGDMKVLERADLIKIIDNEADRTNKDYKGSFFTRALVRMKHISTTYDSTSGNTN